VVTPNARVRLSILLVALGASRGAAAGDAPVRVAYEADASCPSADAFMRALRGRTHSPVELAHERAADIEIVLKKVAQTSTGTVVMNGADGQSVTRKLEADSCEEVAAAAALIAALATGVAAEEPKPPARSELPAPETREPETPDLPPPAPPSSSRWRWSSGALASFSGGVAPSLAYGGVAFVQAEVREFPTGYLAVRGSFGYATSRSAERDWGSASFSLLAARFDACPLFLATSSRAGVAACLGATAGAVTARGQVTQPGGASGGHPLVWLDVTPTARAVLPAGKHVWFEADLGVAVPLLRYEFVLEQAGTPDTTARVYSTPAVAAALGAGIGVAF
jgi:hypothetical protein